MVLSPNFGMPDIIGWVTVPGSDKTVSMLLNRLGLTVKGAAPKFSKRTIPAGLVLFFLVRF
jgi:hypothetical protein